MSDVSVNTLADRGIGDNAPPLAELLVEEMAEARAFDDELIAAAAESRIAGLDDAEKVTVLVSKIRNQERTLTAAHKLRKEPYLRDGRLVDRAYHPEIERLLATRTELERMLTRWKNARDEEARLERGRLAEQQRLREAEADHARAVAEAAKAAGSGSIAAELDAIRATEEAERLARQAETVRPEQIRTAAGSVAMRREINFAIVDEKKTIAWLYKNRRHEILQAARTILGATLRGMGVDGAQHADIPGVQVSIESKATVR